MTQQLSVRPSPFFNRTAELAALEQAWNSSPRTGQLLLLLGRRRLGKTYLLQRFFGGSAGESPKQHCYYLADQTTAPTQRLQLAEQIIATLSSEETMGGVTPEEIGVSWNQILRYVGSYARTLGPEDGRFGLILDEFPYLVQQTPELPSLLQSWWDREGTHLPVFVVLCGSQLSAMEALGAESAPLFGRFTAGKFRLQPLRYDEIAEFYPNDKVWETADRLTIYGALGGTPRYHALVDADKGVEIAITDLLLKPRGALEGEVKYLLGSEQIRDPSPYNAVLGAIAQGHTQFGEILNHSGTERGALSFYLKTLTELGWVSREFPFEETSEKRALYQVADPFLAFWYRFVRPLSSALAFSPPEVLYGAKIEPFLADYMGRFVFEKICHQWLEKHARTKLGVTLLSAGRWWSRDGQIELDIMAERLDGGYLFGECKWSANRAVGTEVFAALLAKIVRLPDARKREGAVCVLFSVGGFTADLVRVADDPANRLHLVSGSDLL